MKIIQSVNTAEFCSFFCVKLAESEQGNIGYDEKFFIKDGQIWQICF